MKIKLLYGTGFIDGEVPDRRVIATYISKREKPIKKEEIEKSIEALNVERGKSVVIITTDITRACPDRDLLPYILKKTQNAKDVKIVVALGLTPL